MNEATIALKQSQVDEVVKEITTSGSTVFVDYLGLTVAEVTDLRVKLHAENCKMKVVKNNILRRATSAAGLSNLESTFAGPSAAVYSKDEVTACKVLFQFAREHDKLNIKSGIISNQVTDSASLKQLATLPNKDGMISMLLSVMQAPIRGLACALKAVSEK